MVSSVSIGSFRVFSRLTRINFISAVYFKPSKPICTIDDIQTKDLQSCSCLISWNTSSANQPKSFTVGISRLDENLPSEFKIVYSGQETTCTGKSLYFSIHLKIEIISLYQGDILQ